MRIFTLVMTKESFSTPPTMEVFGSYSDASEAKVALIEEIINMAQKDEEFSFALWYDENHEDFKDHVSDYGTSFLREAEAIFPECIKSAMRGFLASEIGDDNGVYFIYSTSAYDRDATYRFHVVENELNSRE